jgi:5,5'-dehydrodivanillate O-demethylase
MPSTKRKLKRNNGWLSHHEMISTAPGTLAGRYMRRFWHPVYRAEDIKPSEAKPLRIMSENFTLYRGDTGIPHIVDFRCPHRGAQLSAGWVEGDSIRCMYHGWCFDNSGQCIEQPAEDKPFAKKIRIRSYPAREYLGLIFAYLAEGESPAMPRYAHFEREGYLEVLSTQVWPCNFFQRMDNNGDTAHVSFVHREAYHGVGMRAGLPKFIKVESDWGTTSYASFPGGWTNVFQFVMPNAYAFRNPSPDPDLPWDDRMQWDVPLDDEHALQFRIRLVPVKGQAAREYEAHRRAQAAQDQMSVAELGKAVLSGKIRFRDMDKYMCDKIALVHAQDYVAQVGQGAIADRGKEHLGRSDAGVILFRKVWRRELRAFKEGRRLKKWVLPQEAGDNFTVEPQKNAWPASVK